MKKIAVLFFMVLFLASLSGRAAAWEEIARLSGAEDLADALDEDSRALLSQAGVESWQDKPQGEGLLAAISGMLRERITGPFQAVAQLTAVTALLRLTLSFGEIGPAGELAGVCACGWIVLRPFLGVMRSARRVVEGAAVFLSAAAPVYGALLAASGSPGAAGGYSLLTLGAAELVPILADRVLFPALLVFLALGLASCVSRDFPAKAAEAALSLGKWLLTLSVTFFTGVLTVQTGVALRADGAGSRALKFIASSAIPVVGGAIGDAAAAIRGSVSLVRSGAGAFGMLAGLCLFLPVTLEAALWALVCQAGQIAGECFEARGCGAFLGLCAQAAKLLLALLCSVCLVLLVSCGVMLLPGGEG